MITTIRNDRCGPCKGCPDRFPACSTHCQKPEYLAWKEEQAKIRKAKKDYYSPAWTHAETDPGDYRKKKKTR